MVIYVMTTFFRGGGGVRLHADSFEFVSAYLSMIEVIMVGKPGKLQSHKTEVLCLMLYLTVEKLVGQKRRNAVSWDNSMLVLSCAVETG